jgi:hypothetical protein
VDFNLCNQKKLIFFKNKEIDTKIGNILLVSSNGSRSNFVFIGTFYSYLNSILAIYMNQLGLKDFN